MTITQHQTSDPTPEDRMGERGRKLARLLKSERWSNRQAAQSLGLSHRYIGDRLNGKVDLTFSDIEAFARLLKMKPVDLYVLLGHDSNVEPIGSRLAPVSSLADRTPKAQKASPATSPAVVSQFPTVLRKNA